VVKSPDAFRTISEVAEWLDVPTHVLRFWESRFTQVKPVKRAGGRRYYRPADMELLGGIKKLLHEDGLTIRGVQKILRDDGVRHVSDLSHAVDGPPAAPILQPVRAARDITPDSASAVPDDNDDESPMAVDVPLQPETAEVVAFDRELRGLGRTPEPQSEESLNRWPFVDDPDDPRAHLDASGSETADPGTAETDPVESDPALFAPTPTEPPGPGISMPESAVPNLSVESPTPATPPSEAEPDSAPFTLSGALDRLRTIPRDRLTERADTLRPLIARLADLSARMGSR